MPHFEFGSRTYIMGILNVTPDSFSNDGIYKDPGRAVRYAERIADEGADIIDIGGESTRPGAEPILLKEEMDRVIPVLKAIAKKIKVPISVNTDKAEVALCALDNGATIINDITGLSDKNMAIAIEQYNAKVVIMHMKGTPQTMQQNLIYENLIEDVIYRLSYLIKRASEFGVKKENIIIDPGIGFGKSFEHNLKILNNLSCFKILGMPILVGPSRKAFIGSILGCDPQKRIFGTAACVSVAIKNGADIVRVHDVKEMKQVVQVTDAIIRSGETINV